MCYVHEVIDHHLIAQYRIVPGVYRLVYAGVVLYFGTLSYYDSARMYDPKRFITVMLEFEALTAYYATCPYRRTVLYYGILADYNIFFNSNSLAYNDIVSGNYRRIGYPAARTCKRRFFFYSDRKSVV